jgi:hypothetical protein
MDQWKASLGKMILEDDFDPDEILRDVGDEALEEEMPENERELNFGTLFDQNANFRDVASDLDIS